MFDQYNASLLNEIISLKKLLPQTFQKVVVYILT